MRIEVAREIAKASFRSTRELGNLIPGLKAQLNTDEYATYSKAIATAIAGVQQGVLNRVIATFPELEKEIEDRIMKSGSYS